MIFNLNIRFFDFFDYLNIGEHMTGKRNTKKLIFKAPQKKKKWLVCVRLPIDIKEKLKSQSEKDYKGRGKQSQLVEDAIRYYLHTVSEIKWTDYEKSLDYAELIDDINEGLSQKPLMNATQIFLSDETMVKILDLEKNIKLTKPLMRDVRIGLIRKALSIRLSLGDKAFFDSIMSLN